MPELVGLQARTPDVLGRLSQLLTIRGQRAQVQQTEQDARQRASLAKFDFSPHVGDDGTFDLNSIAVDPNFRAAAGDMYIDNMAKVATAKQMQLEAKSKLFALRGEQVGALGETLGPLMSDPDVAEDNDKGRQKVNEAWMQFGQLYGDEALPVLSAYAPAFQNTPKGKLRQTLSMVQRQATSAAEQIAAQQPRYTNTGAKLEDVNPLTPPGTAPDIPLTLGPGFEITTDANGRQFAINPQTNEVTPIGTGRRGGRAPMSPSVSPDEPTFTQPVPQQKELEEHISTVRKADSDYGTNRHVNDEIIRLSADTSTGPGTKTWHSLIGKVAGLGGGDAIADYQKIGAYLDRQAALSATQMGLPETNAGLQTAASLSGTTEYTPGALQTKVKLTDAMVEGSHQYRKGLDKVIGTGPNQDLSKLQEFRGQWADNFDPNVFRVENAIRRGDKKELSDIKDEIGSRGMAELKKKSDNLEKLERGELLK